MFTPFRNVYELPPVDWWAKALKVEYVYGLYADDIKTYICDEVYRISNERPHKIACGMIGDPMYGTFEPIIYAKIGNNGTVYAFTDVDLKNLDIRRIDIETDTAEEKIEDLPF